MCTCLLTSKTIWGKLIETSENCSQFPVTIPTCAPVHTGCPLQSLPHCTFPHQGAGCHAEESAQLWRMEPVQNSHSILMGQGQTLLVFMEATCQVQSGTQLHQDHPSISPTHTGNPIQPSLLHGTLPTGVKAAIAEKSKQLWGMEPAQT